MFLWSVIFPRFSTTRAINCLAFTPHANLQEIFLGRYFKFYGSIALNNLHSAALKSKCSQYRRLLTSSLFHQVHFNDRENL